MPFTHKTWVNGSGGGTPIDAADLMDLEDRVAAASTLTLETVLATDIGPITSPSATKFLSGSFVAEATTVEITVTVHALSTERLAAYTGLVFFYGTLAQPVWPDTQAADRVGSTRVNLGGISSMPGTEYKRFKLTGLTAGTTYNWAVAGGIIGYMSRLPMPDGPSFVSASIESANATAVPSNFGDTIIAVASLAVLHIVRSNHTSEIKDELLTGSGIPHSAGHGSGGVAISPNALRVIVPHFSLNKATLYDLTAPAQPTVVASDFTCMTGPLAVQFQPNDNTIAWMADFGQALPHVQKLTNCQSNVAPTVATAVQLDTVAAGSIQRISITPDGSKLVCCGATAVVYIVNTSTNAVTKVVPPGSAVANAVGVIDNNTALVHYGTNQVAILDLTAHTFGTAYTSLTAPLAIVAFADGLTAINLKQANSSDNILHVNLPANSGNTAPNEYTHWSTSGTAQDVDLDDRGNIIVVNNTPNELDIWYGAQFFCRPSGAGQALAEKITVTAYPAH